MKALKRLWTWWCGLWTDDFFAATEIDTHRWDNNSEILRRLSAHPN